MNITSTNIDNVVRDLRQDLGVELLSKEAEIFDELLRLAVKGLDSDSPQVDKDGLEDEINDLKSALYRIADIVGEY